jgi:phosphomannomutase
MKKVWEEKADLGIAYDINGHRLRIIGDDYKCYPKDISLALIADHYANLGLKPCYLVTNISSSLRLDILTEEYDIKLVKTAIGEFFLALKIHSLMKEYPNAYIFGGEGSNGGVMIPKFNNTRDAIFATVKIIELLQGTNKKISSLVNEFPDYHKYTENINIEDINVTQLITKIKQELRSEGEKVFQMGNDLRIDNENESFTLIHPSTTEPVIRIIAEAKRKSLARILSQTTAELIRMILKTNE